MTPDLILHNSLLLTATSEDSATDHLTALCVQGDRITAIGSEELLDTATRSTVIIDLEGRTLLPGINDGHLHVGGYASGRPPAALDVSPQEVSSIADIVSLIARETARTPPGNWIRGRGWFSGSLIDLPGAEPTASLLDDVSPHHPVALTDFSGHALWANSCAMQTANVTSDTPVPVGGIARRDAVGELTGLFVESAQSLIVDHIPTLNDDQLEAAVRSTLAEFHRQGITSITDAALNPLPGSEDQLGGARVFELLHRLCGPNDIPMRTNVLLNFSSLGSTTLIDTVNGLLEYENPPSEPDWFNVRGLKVFADGVPPNCTAWMHQSYPDGGHGCLTLAGDTDADRVEELGQIIRAGHEAGVQVGVHVTGDRATDAVVEGFVTAMNAFRRPHPRHYIIHGPFASRNTLERASAAGIGINVQPSLKSVSALLIESLFGREMSNYQWPLRTILRSGCVMASSSDAPVTSPNWREGIGNAVSRRASNGEVYGPEQIIGVDEAIRSYTAAGAWQDGAESWKGTLEVGKVADLCVVDGRLSTDDPLNFASMDVSLTVVGGAIVHGGGWAK